MGGRAVSENGGGRFDACSAQQACRVTARVVDQLPGNSRRDSALTIAVIWNLSTLSLDAQRSVAKSQDSQPTSQYIPSLSSNPTVTVL
jgi:hypothetical protein